MNDTYFMQIERAKKAIKDAQYILLGGGAGLSAAAGIEYSGKRFTDNFSPFIKRYGFTDLYSSGFYPFKTQEEKWAYWAKHISLNRYELGATKLYRDIFQLVKDKNYFVISTNVESQFNKAGFPSDKVFEIQGDYSYLQCAKGCHDKLYYNESNVKEMIEKTIDCKIPSQLVPKCPVCGGEMEVNLRIDEYFVQDERWYELNKSYKDFLNKSEGQKVIYIELGVGFNTPGIIRYPFERLTYENENATLIRLNRDYPEGAKENKNKTISFAEDMQEVVSAIMN
ncbi:Sir2 silent information regulator family NAD-dependent deacetylase [Priestia megaterium]|uniref:Sir2 silent information regulator family NAD-dependent deacetylase n=1 Tax=Priestia megaterium TaxID=1404 RepID=A0A3D8WWW7_PRIMG|nr:Sir2 silent information regulator family NAD-dependent deacetylase [Priestia megaterium]MDH3169461.1 Sir2 silent information regulator family NAD-dependent deacetylase [Priestia megaterium]RDZ10110.1 Sir2 silent information regulator family NAD-dependent deacetylase [Priestia megaterium]